MFPNVSDPRKAVIFYAITLSLTLLVSASYLFGGASPLVVLFVPTIAVILMLAWIAPEGNLRAALHSTGLTKAGLSGWPLAILGPVGLLAFAYTGVWMTSYASFKPLDPSRDTVEVIASLVIALMISLPLFVIRALPEEFAWRGYMLPRLAQSGVLRAMLAIGFLQGVWGLAIALTMPYFQFPDKTPMILLLITLTLQGVFYGYLRLTTGSVWPVAIAHGVFSGTWSLMYEMTEVHSPDMFEYTSNVFPIVGLLVLALILIQRLRAKGIILAN